MAHIPNHIRHSKSDFIEAENTVVAIRERLAKQAHKPHWIGVRWQCPMAQQNEST